MSRRRSFVLGGALLALVSGCGRPARGERLVLITIDTWRADSLEADLENGPGAGSNMPATLAFARRGARFTQAYSATSTTQPSHASLLTGLHPWQHGVTRNGEVLGEERTTLAERLAEHGYQTAAVVASFPLGRRFGFAQGFERFRDELSVTYTRRWEGEEIQDGRFFTLGEEITDAASELLAGMTGARQFLWVHYFDPHDPYGDAAQQQGQQDRQEDGERASGAGTLPIAAVLQAAGAGEVERARALVERAHRLYRRDLSALDQSLARLFARLDQDAERFETHVVLTGDHGESFGEQGCLGHGKRLVPAQVHVPLAIVSPRLPPGVRDEPVGSVDVGATLFQLAGLGSEGLAGRNLLASGRAAGTAFGMRREFSQTASELLLDGRRLAVSGVRFFAVHGGRVCSGDGELVLEEDDPERPLAGAEAAELRAAFAGFAARLEGTSVERLESDEVRAALQALGYGE